MAGRYRRLDDGLAVRLDFARGRKPDFELLAGPQGEKLGKVQASNDMIACFQYMIFQIVPQESTPALHCRRLDAAALHERQIAKCPPNSIAIAMHQQRSEEHTSELQSLMRISYAVFCLKKKHTTNTKRRSK